MNLFQVIIICAVLSIGIFGCSEDSVTTPSPVENEFGELVIEFDNVVGDQQMQLDGPEIYTNAAGEKFNFTEFSYYVSNIILTDANGKTYVVPQDSSYFLIKESDKSSGMVRIKSLPEGDYTAITFTIGVDSVRNTMDVSKRKGALDPANGMYWSWNSGYIFVKAEGASVASGNGAFRYHIGGFGGMTSATINNIKTVRLPFNGDKATVRKTITPQVHLLVDALKLFNGSTTVSIAANPTVMFNPYSVNIANNYSSMFSVDHVHND